MVWRFVLYLVMPRCEVQTRCIILGLMSMFSYLFLSRDFGQFHHVELFTCLLSDSNRMDPLLLAQIFHALSFLHSY